MIVSDTAIKNRISVLVLALIILGLGIYSYKSLPRESEPDITIPYVFVQTDYRGVSASDIETEVKEHLLSLMTKITGKKIVLHENINNDLLGGFVVRIGDYQYDASTKTLIRKLKEDFSKNLFITDL